MIKIRVHLALIAVLTVSLSAGFRESVCALQVLFDEISPKFDKNGLILDELVLRNITFTPEYARTLEEKQIALENITTEKNKLEQEKIRKEQIGVSQQSIKAWVISDVFSAWPLSALLTIMYQTEGVTHEANHHRTCLCHANRGGRRLSPCVSAPLQS